MDLEGWRVGHHLIANTIRQGPEALPPDAADRLGKRADIPQHPAISARSIVAVELFYWANAFGQKLVGRAEIQQVDDGDDRTQRTPRRHEIGRASSRARRGADV